MRMRWLRLSSRRTSSLMAGGKATSDRQIGQRVFDIGCAGLKIQQVEHGAIGKQDGEPGIKRGDPARDGVEDEFELPRRRSARVRFTSESRAGGGFGKRAALLQIGGHALKE